MRLAVSAVLASVLLVGGCAVKSEPERTGEATPPTTTDTTARTAATATATSVTVHGGGVSASQQWHFGANAVLVTADLERAFGARPTAKTMECEAGATELRTWPEMTALIQDDEFVGWSIPTTGRAIRTGKNIGVGSDRTDLLNAYPNAQVAESSLGIEWSVDDGGRGFLVGLLEHDAPSAQVVSIWSGNACIFR